MSREYLIRLGWPNSALSPNSRKDRRSITDIRKRAKQEGWAEAKKHRAEIAENAHILIEFFPPDNRRRDLDNLLASMKSHLDGIASAAGVDDAGWSFTISKGPKVKGGAVLVHVLESDNSTVPMRGNIS